MGKHKSKKRISKKRVQRRVQKMKDLTPEDLLLHPELLQSPQFRALPLEKQFQLMTAYKQLRMMTNRPMMGVGASSGGGGGADSAMYHKLNDILNRNAYQENANAQLKAQFDAELERQKQLHEAQSQLKKEQKRKEKELKAQVEMKKVEEAFDEINKEEANNSLKDLKAQYELAKKDLRADKIHDLLVQIEFMRANLQELNTTPKIGSPIRPKVKIDMMTQAKDENLQTQFVLQNQINAFTDAGESEKAEHLEDTLLDLESERVGELPTNDDELKKNINESFEENNKEVNEPSEPVQSDDNLNIPQNLQLNENEKKGINLEVQLENQKQTFQEQVERQEELNKQKQKNQQTAELIIAQNSNSAPKSTNIQTALQQQINQNLNEFNDTVEQIKKSPSYGVELEPKWAVEMAQIIKNSRSFQELRDNYKDANARLHQFLAARREQEAKQKTQQAAQSAIIQTTNTIPDTSEGIYTLEKQKRVYIEKFKVDISNLPFRLDEKFSEYVINSLRKAKTFEELDSIWDMVQIELEGKLKDYHEKQRITKSQSDLLEKSQLHREKAFNLVPSTSTGKSILISTKTQALDMLEEVMNSAPNPNQNYRAKMNDKITKAKTQNELNAYIQKLTKDKELCVNFWPRYQSELEKEKKPLRQLVQNKILPKYQKGLVYYIDKARFKEELKVIERMINARIALLTSDSNNLFNVNYHVIFSDGIRQLNSIANQKMPIGIKLSRDIDENTQQLSPCLDWILSPH
ncbi:hypothetical protein [Methanobrevibacter sp.]|uniref:hypothetical protein n=1 Tax=Methanobrevibacter sp. TaxID=66852 RepID=UPI0038634B4F